jgi:NAD(P)-dependent dehydrogenase (short-subunit alcohol dehydrogenase family)
VAAAWRRIEILSMCQHLDGLPAAADEDVKGARLAMSGGAASSPPTWMARTMTKAQILHLAPRAGIINILSVLGRFGVPGYAAYCTSKHGLLSLHPPLALELAGRGITVNAICRVVRPAAGGCVLPAPAHVRGLPDGDCGRADERMIEPEEVAESPHLVQAASAMINSGQSRRPRRWTERLAGATALSPSAGRGRACRGGRARPAMPVGGVALGDGPPE